MSEDILEAILTHRESRRAVLKSIRMRGSVELFLNSTLQGMKDILSDVSVSNLGN